jgi:hypothetical protein
MPADSNTRSDCAEQHDTLAFTDDDIAVGPVLGPEYRASLRWSEAVTANLDPDQIKPIITKAADDLIDAIWTATVDHLLADTEHNAAGAVRHMVEQTIEALLTGKEWAMKRYPYADYSKGEDIRAAVAKHGGDELLMRRIADLEAELAKKEETIQWLRR